MTGDFENWKLKLQEFMYYQNCCCEWFEIFKDQEILEDMKDSFGAGLTPDIYFREYLVLVENADEF